MKTFYKESKVVEIYCEKNEIHLNERKKNKVNFTVHFLKYT